MLPDLTFPSDPQWYVPDVEACKQLWDQYAMLPNVREHSQAVAHVAEALAEKAQSRGLDMDKESTVAAALLHDLAKSYTIQYGGAHDQLGAAWVMEETRNPALAQAVLFHVYWPWSEGALAPEANPLRLPLVVSYADKRVRHAEVVSLEDRFDDLLERYGTTERYRTHILANKQQSQIMEAALIRLLGPLDSL